MQPKEALSLGDRLYYQILIGKLMVAKLITRYNNEK